MAGGTRLLEEPKKGKGLLIVLFVLLGIFLALMLVLGGFYAKTALSYQGKFLPGTTLNGQDISGMTVTEAEQLLLDGQQTYELLIAERDGATETITGEQIGMTLNLGNTIAETMESQNIWAWPKAVYFGEEQAIVVDTLTTYDEELLEQAIAALNCMDLSAAVRPQDAYLSEFDQSTGSVNVVPEVRGNLVEPELVAQAIRDAVSIFASVVDLEALGCYYNPTITANDPDLNAQAEALNSYLDLTFIYQLGDDTKVIDYEELQYWLTFHEDGTVTLDEEAVANWVAELRYEYATIFSNRVFTTTSGTTITVEGGDYGWWMNTAETTANLIEAINNRQDGEMSVTWYQEAGVLGKGANGDYGNTYIEINLTAQHLYYYKDGELVLDSAFVSGRNDATPTGTYSVLYRERFATLTGENYASPVSYWMPFYESVGLHDASWRTTFGGSIYQSSGSHGCINLPIKVAKSLYETVATGTAVIVYKLEGTENSETQTQSYEDIASAVVEALDEISQTAEITSGNYNVMSKKINWARAAYNSLPGSARSLVTNYDLLTQAVSKLNAYEAGR